MASLVDRADLNVSALPDGSIDLPGGACRIACARFANRVFLTASQLPSFGSLYHVELELYPDGMRFFNVRCLLGAGAGQPGRRAGGGDDGDDDIPDVQLLCARRIAELVYDDCGVDLMLSLALRPDACTEAGARTLLTHLAAERPWAHAAGFPARRSAAEAAAREAAIARAVAAASGRGEGDSEGRPAAAYDGAAAAAGSEPGAGSGAGAVAEPRHP